MKTILVDDQPLSVKKFEEECKKNNLFDVIGIFKNPITALEFSKTNHIDFAILDIHMNQMNGLELGALLKERYPNIIIFYVTAYDEYAAAALKQKADYFISKPYSIDDVTDSLIRAKLLSKRYEKNIFIRTFGNFDVFIDNKPIYFSSAKSKELLALLVNKRGGIISTEEAMGIIWEDKFNLSLCRTAAMRLRKTLESYGIQNILVEKNGNRSVNTDLFDCDYYLFLQGSNDERCIFTGEYMAQYSWAEVTLATISQKINIF